MAKLVKLGKPKEIPVVRLLPPAGPPPAGLIVVCQSCEAVLETEAEDATAKATLHQEGQGLATVLVPGWYFICPSCGYTRVFLPEHIA